MKELHIGLVLSALPSYSETFIVSKIRCLVESRFIVSLFVDNYSKYCSIDIDIPIYYQPTVTRKYMLPIIIIPLIFKNPIVVFNFIRHERIANRSWVNIIKNIIMNSHILSKRLNWIHFEFATIGINRENIARAMRIKSAVSFRGFDIGLYPHNHQGCYNLLWKTIDKVHTISDDLYQQAIDLGLNPDIPMKKVTPAIDLDIFKSNNYLSLHNPLRILFVGRLTWKKGIEYSLRSLAFLKKEDIDFEYRIIGNGDYKEAIQYAICQLGLNDNVMLKGQLSHEDVKHEMEWADIYIQPSIQEGFCNAVLEAQAMGLLCIVTDADGLSENILDEETGWVVPKRSPKQLFEKIKHILSFSLIDLNQIRENAKNRVNNEFNLNKQKKRFINFYQS